MIINKTEENIIEWLVKHETMGRVLTKMYISGFISNPDILEKGIDKLLPEFSLQVAVIDFYTLMDFLNTFANHYGILIEKYHNPLGDGVSYENNIEYYESKETSLLDYIAPAFKITVEDVFKNHKEPFEAKKLKHLVPFKAFQSAFPNAQLQKAHDTFHEDKYEDAIDMYKELLVSRNDLHEARAGLAISYFILENYEMAEIVAADLSQYQYKELLQLITKVKSGVQSGGFSDTSAYERANLLCWEVLIEGEETRDRDAWLAEYEDLFNSVSIAPEGLPSVANSNFNGKKYEHIFYFHNTYVKRKFESTILDNMSHSDAVEYFISRMDIIGLDIILDYREYADVSKKIFLEKLDAVFNVLKRRGNTRLNSTEGVCKGCQNGHRTVAFIGNYEESYIELIILAEYQRVTDIFECNYFSYNSYNKEFLGQRLSLRIEDDDMDTTEFYADNDDLPF